MSKFNTNRIGVLVLTPCIVCIIALCAATVYCFFALKYDLQKVEFRQLMTLSATISRMTEQKNQSAEVACETLSDDYEEFYNAVEADDTYTMGDELEWTRVIADAQGYIFMDMDDIVRCSTYPKEVTDGLEDAATHAREIGTFSAYAFTGNRMLLYTATVVKNTDKEPLGVAFLVSTSQELGSKTSSKTFGAKNYIFRGKECVLSAGEDTVKMKNVELSQEIYEACYADSRKWVGKTGMFGQDNYVTAMPMKDYKGEVIGALVCVGDSSLTDGIMRNMYMALPVMLVLFVALLIFIYVRLKRRMLRPINQLIVDINQIAEGDLTQDVHVDRACDEIEVVATSVHRMEDKIREVIEPIRRTSEALVNAASQMKSASDNLSNAANRQAASLEEISSSMEEMGANIQQNTDNSVHTNKLAEEIAQATKRLGEVSNMSMEAIRSIADSISDINDLVSQTNILALNASVEAARAGEHGQGFGVVAKEVGRLAEQTHDTASAINATASNSIEGAEEAYNHVNELAPRIEKINSLVKEITTASIEQNTGVQQVNSAIMDLNRMTQQNAAGAEEIAASSAQMQEMVKKLNDAIGAFKIEG